MTAPVTPLQFSYAPRTGVSLLLLPVSSILFHLLGAFALAFLSIKTLFPTEIYLADSLTLQIFAEMLPSQWRWPRPPFLIIQPTCSPAVACSVLFILPSLFFPHTINIIFYHITCMHAKSLQSCLTLCDFMGCSLPGFSVHGIFQARILEWVTISFSRRSSWPRDWTRVAHIVGRCFTIWDTRELIYLVYVLCEFPCQKLHGDKCLCFIHSCIPSPQSNAWNRVDRQ